MTKTTRAIDRKTAKPLTKKRAIHCAKNGEIIAPKTSKTTAKTTKKGGRKVERDRGGRFVSGHTPIIAENPGRKPETLSVRGRARLMVEDNPALVDDALNNLFNVAKDPNNQQCISAIDKIIKMIGGYDPIETKDVTPKVIERPLEGADRDKLRKLLGVK